MACLHFRPSSEPPDVDPRYKLAFRRQLTLLTAERLDKGPGNAYGAFLLPERFTRWDGDTGTLDLYYLLSLWSPYQVQVMRTTLRLGVTIPEWLTKEVVRPSAEQLGLLAEFVTLRQKPGFAHKQVIAINPPAGTFVQRGSRVIVSINLED